MMHEHDAIPHWLKRYIIIVIVTALVTISVRTFVVQLYSIPSSSMAPTLIIGDYMVVNKFAYGYGSEGTLDGLLPFSGRLLGKAPQRGDIIVFKNPVSGITFIKRLIGLPGDRIKMTRGALYINDAEVPRERLDTPLSFPGDDEPTADIVDYVEELPGHAPHVMRLIRERADQTEVNNTDIFTVPDGCYFFMGDNRDNSMDSRVVGLGFVPAGNIVGKAELLFFSLEKDASLWEFYNWPWSIRHHRLWQKIN